MVATSYNRVGEWEEALQICDYDVEKPRARNHSESEKCKCEHQGSKLSFKECCGRLRARDSPSEGNAYDHLWEDVDIREDDFEYADSDSITSEEDEQSNGGDRDTYVNTTAHDDESLVELTS
jgi:hypothetical protein